MNELKTIYGGETVPVTFRDGTTGEVRLRAIRIGEIEQYLGMAVDAAEDGLRFCIESPKDIDFDSLTDESFNELFERNYELNFQRALALKEAQIARARKMRMGLTKTLRSAASLLAKYAPQSLSQEALSGIRF